jgi:outer membrane protein assembly factor BamB
MRAAGVGLGLACLFAAAPARTTPCTVTGATWCEDTGGTTMSAPTGLTALGLPRTWVASGGTLITFDSGDGTILGSQPGIGTVSNRPMPVDFGGGSQAVFVASNDGYVFRIDASTGSCVWKSFVGRTTAAGVDVTPGCTGSVAAACAGDQVVGTPAVRFGATESDAIVYVGTRYATSGGGGCGTTSRNRVYALNAVTGDPVWVFNAPGVNDYRNLAGPYSMSYVAEGVFPDVWDDGCGEPGIRDRIYVGSNGGTGTLWGLDALTGAFVWTASIGGVRVTPILSYNAARCERLYVGQTAGRVRAYGITATACGGGAVPCLIWSRNTSGAVQLNPAVAQYGPDIGKIYVTNNNRMQVFIDNGASASTVCTYNPAGSPPDVRAEPALTSDKIYVGLTSGDVAELNKANCTGVVLRTLESGFQLGDASVDATVGFGSAWLVIGSANGRVARFNVPF